LYLQLVIYLWVLKELLLSSISYNRHDITDILLNVALNTIILSFNPLYVSMFLRSGLYLQSVICLCVFKELLLSSISYMSLVWKEVLVYSISYLSLGSWGVACIFNQLYISEFLWNCLYLRLVIYILVFKGLLVSSIIICVWFLRSCLYLQSVICL